MLIDGEQTLALTSTAKVERSGRLKVAAVGVQRIVDRDGWTGWAGIGHCPLRRILDCPIYMEFHSRRLRILEISHEKQRDEPPRQPCMFNIPVIPTQFEVATLWESGYSKVEGKFTKTRNVPQAIPCASFE